MNKQQVLKLLEYHMLFQKKKLKLLEIWIQQVLQFIVDEQLFVLISWLVLVVLKDSMTE